MERAGLAAAERRARDAAGERGRACWFSRGPATTAATRSSSRGWLQVVVLRRHRRLSRRRRAACRADAAAAHARMVARRRRDGRRMAADCDDWGSIVDGLFGIGLARAVEGDYAAHGSRAPTRRRAPILALDIPSGLDADTGVAQAPAIRAPATATFIALKPGLLTADGPDHCGAITRASPRPRSRGDARRRAAIVSTGESLARGAAGSRCCDATRNVHKGTFGTLGDRRRRRRHGRRSDSRRSRGAASRRRQGLGRPRGERAARGRLGAARADAARRAARCSRATPTRWSSVRGSAPSARARELLAQALALRLSRSSLDADALNLIADDPDARCRGRGARGADAAHAASGRSGAPAGDDDGRDPVRSPRRGARARVASSTRRVVLKGAGSVLAHPDGSLGDQRERQPGARERRAPATCSPACSARLLAQGIAARDRARARRLPARRRGRRAASRDGIGPLGVTASELAAGRARAAQRRGARELRASARARAAAPSSRSSCATRDRDAPCAASFSA